MSSYWNASIRYLNGNTRNCTADTREELVTWLDAQVEPGHRVIQFGDRVQTHVVPDATVYEIQDSGDYKVGYAHITLRDTEQEPAPVDPAPVPAVSTEHLIWELEILKQHEGTLIEDTFETYQFFPTAYARLCELVVERDQSLHKILDEDGAVWYDIWTRGKITHKAKIAKAEPGPVPVSHTARWVMFGYEAGNKFLEAMFEGTEEQVGALAIEAFNLYRGDRTGSWSEDPTGPANASEMRYGTSPDTQPPRAVYYRQAAPPRRGVTLASLV